MFEYLTYTRAAKLCGISRPQFIRAHRRLRKPTFPVEGSGIVLVHRRDLKDVRMEAKATRAGRPKKRGR